MISHRNICVLCHSDSKLLTIKSIKSPYHFIDNSKEEEYDLTYGYCENCFSVQLMTLLNPEILYDGYKNILPFSANYNWIQHNISFIQFVVSCINTNQPIIEIGSSSFLLGKHLIEFYKDYTVFDISLKTCEKKKDVKYIEGNCENYQFENESNILMSHVFEHLYEPKKFIENCFKNSVKNIIISIPNMNSNNVFHITNQHTFLYNDTDIEYIFSLYNYKCTKKIFFNTNDESFPCMFFNFSFVVSGVLNIERTTTTKIPIYHSISNFLNNTIKISKNTFIATAVMFSSILFNLIIEKDNIIGVIDQNIDLHGKTFSNTNLLIYSYEHLKSFDESTNIIVCHQRKNDIINCIRKVNNKITIIVIE